MKSAPTHLGIRMQDIAEKAGVSIGTVSRVLRGRPDVSPDLTERVFAVAQKMGYRRPLRNRAGGAAKAAESLTLAYLVDVGPNRDWTHEAFFQRFAAGIQKQTSTVNGHLLFASCRQDIERDVLPSLVTNGIANGVIVKTYDQGPWLKKLQMRLPTVVLMNKPDDRAVSSVTCDNYSGSYQAVKHLVELGHRRIGFLSIENGNVPEDSRDNGINIHHAERAEAFLKHVRLFGCEENPAYVQVPLRDWTKESNEEVISRALDAFLALGSKRPTAIIAATEIYAKVLTAVAKQRNLLVPKDFSLITYQHDGLHTDAPLISCLELRGEDMGAMAVSVLLEQIKNPLAPPVQIAVGMKYLQGQSCAPVSA
ncbi:MAG: LacI family DNA-binding transcriptional regulator [Chthoniobacteraceae bacterium]